MSNTNKTFIFNKLLHYLLVKLDAYGQRKTLSAKECCRRYDVCHKTMHKLEHGDLCSFNAKFFDYLD